MSYLRKNVCEIEVEIEIEIEGGTVKIGGSVCTFRLVSRDYRAQLLSPVIVPCPPPPFCIPFNLLIAIRRDLV